MIGQFGLPAKPTVRLYYKYSKPLDWRWPKRNKVNKYGDFHFKNPLGLAAGFDKNGTTPRAMQALGFGFVEVGSITAKSSAGNPKPRAFRLPEDHSLINRMGLNNQGATAIVKRLSKLQLEIPLGVNVAKTNDSTIEGDAAVEDYIESYLLAQQVADYITINISCPNTGEGKTLKTQVHLGNC